MSAVLPARPDAAVRHEVDSGRYSEHCVVNANAMCAGKNMDTGLFAASELGAAYRANRRKLGRTMQWVAERVGCRRQTIADLEAGRNVGLYTLFAALAALDKGLEIIDSRIDMDRIKALLDDED